MKTLLKTIFTSFSFFVVYGCNPTVPIPISAPIINLFTVDSTGLAVWSVNSSTTISLALDDGVSISVLGVSSYQFTELTPNSYHTAVLLASNAGGSVTKTVNFKTGSPALTAVFTVTALTGTLLTNLPGNSAARIQYTLHVTTAGSAKMDCIGTLTNGNPAIASYWITNKDSVEVFQSTSTLNPILRKTAMLASQIINLPLGTCVICFKTAPYSGAIPNETSLGIKITGANNSFADNESYTADATSSNLANVVKLNFIPDNGGAAPGNMQTTNFSGGNFMLIPYNNELGTTYDGNLYPSISLISFDLKNTSWVSDTTGYSGLDFLNTKGLADQYFKITMTDSITSFISVFITSNANLSSDKVLTFSTTIPVKMVKSLGNYCFASFSANVYNTTSIQFGPASICWYLKSIRLSGNPELWIYDPFGNRIW